MPILWKADVDGRERGRVFDLKFWFFTRWKRRRFRIENVLLHWFLLISELSAGRFKTDIHRVTDKCVNFQRHTKLTSVSYRWANKAISRRSRTTVPGGRVSRTTSEKSGQGSIHAVSPVFSGYRRDVKRALKKAANALNLPRPPLPLDFRDPRPICIAEWRRRRWWPHYNKLLCVTAVPPWGCVRLATGERGRGGEWGGVRSTAAQKHNRNTRFTTGRLRSGDRVWSDVARALPVVPALPLDGKPERKQQKVETNYAVIYEPALRWRF